MSLRIVIASAAVVVVGGGIAAGLALGRGGAATAHGRLPVVAAENAWGDVAAQIGGSRVAVTSILTSPNADPHLFQPGTATGLAVARAAVVIENGLGYDAFARKLQTAAPSALRRRVVIADALGVHGADANPHLWYDVPRLGDAAAAIERALERADPRGAADYRAGLRRFDASLAPLRAELARIRARSAGAPVAWTEPVPGYLVAAAGLDPRTPRAFGLAIEEGREPTPAALAAATTLVERRQVRVLLYNAQAVSPITAQLRAAARRAGVPVVPVRETLPPGSSLQRWLLAETRALARALG